MILALSGCNAAPEKSAEENAAPKPARSEVQQGPVKVAIEVTPAKAQLSDELTLTLSIDYEEGVTIQKPPFGGSLGSFLIRDFHEPAVKIHDGRELVRQIYTLEPTETGKMLIDPIGITFTDNRPNGDHRTHTIETESVALEITSILGDKAPSLGDLHPAAQPVDLPTSASYWIWGLAIAFPFIAGLAWWLLRRKRGESSVAARLLSPEEVAIRDLDALEQSGLAARDIKLFYVELTGIVRRYIEQTTGIRAPEQTTEEFLREISRGSFNKMYQNSPLPQAGEGPGVRADRFATTRGTVPFSLRENRDSPQLDHQDSPRRMMDDLARLRDFLEAADLVKFAAHMPRTEDVTESVRRARLFINIRRVEQAIPPERATA